MKIFLKNLFSFPRYGPLNFGAFCPEKCKIPKVTTPFSTHFHFQNLRILKKVGSEAKMEWGHWAIHCGFVGKTNIPFLFCDSPYLYLINAKRFAYIAETTNYKQNLEEEIKVTNLGKILSVFHKLSDFQFFAADTILIALFTSSSGEDAGRNSRQILFW